MQKPITVAEPVSVRVVVVTLDHHLAGASERARIELERSTPGLKFSLHAASQWEHDPASLERCKQDIAKGDIIIANMLFMEDHIQAVLPDLQARRASCDAMIGCLSAGEVIRLTKLGNFSMNREHGGVLALLKRLKGDSSKRGPSSSGERQMAMLRRIPKLLRFIPGTAQDVRAYFLTLQYWLAGSEENIVNMVRHLVDRYAEGPRRSLRGKLPSKLPSIYPDVGLYHPHIPERLTENRQDLPASGKKGTVGLLLMRSYILSGNTAHYDGVIASLEKKGLIVVPAFAAGLDARPAIEKFFKKDGRACVDAVVSLTGFSLVGGPAYNNAKAAEEMLSSLDLPYLAAHALEFQTLEQWGASERGLMPIEQTMMVAIPELDGATGPMVFGGRSSATGEACTGCERKCVFPIGEGERNMHVCPERAEMLAARVHKVVELRRKERSERKIAIVLFNFPPNSGATGTAAFLSVFSSLFNTLKTLAASGYIVDLPHDVEDLRQRILKGNASAHGSTANVVARVSVDQHVRRQKWLKDIEAQWGIAPGRQQSDGNSVFILGAEFGNVLVAIQPAFGYEGDPMRLLFEKTFAPTHAFAAFYRYLREDFSAHAVLHFGTHGALEFMPGKQAGVSGSSWSDRLIGDLPNFYLYAANNPSEGTIAKRRSAATLISYLTPPIAQAGLYRGLLDLKASIQRWRNLEPEHDNERKDLLPVIQAQAAQVDLAEAEPSWQIDTAERLITALWTAVLELEYTLIPNGLHVIGETMNKEERLDLLKAAAEARPDCALEHNIIKRIVEGDKPEVALSDVSSEKRSSLLVHAEAMAELNRLLSEEHELSSLLHALDGHFVRPAPAGDLIRTPQILPTGRNLHGFDPFRIPSAFALRDGARQSERLLNRYRDDGHPLPASVAMVLWGTDNLKTEGGPIGQALALMGARPRFDSYGRLCGAELIPLHELGRPRIDVVVTLSGIFRDLLPLQTKLLAEAAWLAASAEEPEEQNYIRRHALNYMREKGVDLETAALRVFSNADGAYGANVNHLIEAGSWQEENELAETYTRRKCFAYSRSGKPQHQSALLESVLSEVKLTYQNLESVEVGVTTIDHYFDTLGGISRAVRRASGAEVPVYIGDQTRGEGLVRSLSEQVALETRTRTLNPKWYESMLKHGYEGVRHIEAQVTNTLGWSATTGQVAPWVYNQITQTFVLDEEMRERLALLNPTAAAKVANRLLEAHERNYWRPDPSVLEALKNAGADLEDRLEGISVEAAA
ncbi:MAG: magnesium chelatase subunit H [Hyphomicrobium sp.]